MLEGTLVLNYASVLQEKICLIVFFPSYFCLTTSPIHPLSLSFSANDSYALPLSIAPLWPPPQPLLTAALSSNFFFLTSHAENQNMGRMKVKRSVSWAAYKQLISQRGFFFFFLPLVLLHWCKSTRLTECSKSSGSKTSTLLFWMMGVGLDPEG